MKVWHGLLVLAGLVAYGLYAHAHHPQAEMYVGSADSAPVQIAFGFAPGGTGGSDLSGGAAPDGTGGGWADGGAGISCGCSRDGGGVDHGGDDHGGGGNR